MVPPARGSEPPADTAGIGLGERIYNDRCYFCHGYDGKADTVAASFLSPRPVNFTRPPPGLDRARMIHSVTHGRRGTAMQAFAKVLTAREIGAVVDFVRATFMQGKTSGAYYHTPENGWPDMRRYAPAIPFALGKITLDTPLSALTPRQRLGRRLFMSSCITCHGRGQAHDRPPQWEPQAARPSIAPASPSAAEAGGGGGGYYYGDEAHNHPLQLRGLTSAELHGQLLFQRNCAHCHAADGTGRNWIGKALLPHPRDLTDSAVAAGLDAGRLRHIIAKGVAGTAMPAWERVLSPAQIDDVIAYVNKAFLSRR